MPNSFFYSSKKGLIVDTSNIFLCSFVGYKLMSIDDVDYFSIGVISRGKITKIIAFVRSKKCGINLDYPFGKSDYYILLHVEIMRKLIVVDTKLIPLLIPKKILYEIIDKKCVSMVSSACIWEYQGGYFLSGK